MPDGDDVAPSDENRRLAILEFLAFQMGGLCHHEQLFAVGFHLGHLMGVDGVFDRERVQLIGFGQRMQLVR